MNDFPIHVNRFTPYDGSKNASLQDLRRRNSGNVSIQHNEVRVLPRSELAFFRFSKFGVSRGLRVRVESLLDSQFFLCVVTRLTRFIHPGHGGVAAAKRRYGLDRVIRAERQWHMTTEECLPSVRSLRPLWP